MPNTKDKPLTAKQQGFCREYMIDSCGTRAAIRAGYSPKTAEVQASRMLSKVKIKAEIARKRAKIEANADITRQVQLDRLDKLLDMAIEQKNVTAGKACITEQNEMLGYHRDNAPNAEREAGKAQRLTDEERELAALMARHRTDAEARERPTEGRTLKIG